MILSRLVTVIAAALSVAAQAQGDQFQTVRLTNPRAISEAMSVNAAIDAVMKVTASCHASSLNAALSCTCSATGDLDRLKIAYRQAAARHPDWDQPNVIVFYVNPTNGHSVSLNFTALRGTISRCERR
jgi:hypothetical protein